MSLTFGYDMKDGDKILEASNQFTGILRPLVVPGRGAVVNHFPFCTVFTFILSCLWRFMAVFSASHPFMGPVL